MDSNYFWAGLVLVLLLVDVGVIAALALVILWVNRTSQSHRDIPASISADTQPARQGRKAPDAGVKQPTAASSIVIGPPQTVVISPIGEQPLVIAPSQDPTVQPLVIGPSQDLTVVIAPVASVTVDPPPRAAWDDRGWLRRNEKGQIIYEGEYHVADRRSGQRRRFRGVVVQSAGEVVPNIADPPLELRNHPKQPCFQLSKPPWFKLHWHRAAGNVDDAIIYIERVLDEAINGRRAA